MEVVDEEGTVLVVSTTGDYPCFRKVITPEAGRLIWRYGKEGGGLI